MAALPAGVQYGLSSESSYKENKDLVFVKLTDSALKAIEDYIRNNRAKLATPTIQFLPGNEGKFSIPAGSNGQQSPATFHFSVTSNAEMEGPQGSFECVRSGGPRRLESCGPMPRRMRVQANDDSYEATKHRMAKTVAEEQSKCTRVIKPNQTDIGRRVKVRQSAAHAHSAHAAAAAPALSAHSPAARPAPLLPQSAPQPLPQLPAQPQPHQAPPQTTQPSQPHSRPPRNPDLTRRSIKERLIQLLALRPFKKPELYARLISEGIKDKERPLIGTILMQISSLKDNCFQLHRHIWNDVNEDWPFYTEEEKRQLKRRKPQNLTPPLSSDSATSLSPRASPGGGGGGGGKRAGGAGAADGEAEGPVAKKQRISHYRKADAAPTGSPSSGYATGGSGASSGERHASDTEDDRTMKKDNGYTLSFNTAKEFCSSPIKSNDFSRSSPRVEQTTITVKDITNPDTIDSADIVDMEEIQRQYPTITSSAMRRMYKSEFSRQYEEYRAVYGRVARVAGVFTRLEQELRGMERGSPRRGDVKQRIVDEYRRVQRDHKYLDDRRRLTYLHHKLTHIKHAVHAYDNMSMSGEGAERGVGAGLGAAY